MIPGKEVYYDLERNRFAYPIKHVIIYRFSENLFFANNKVLVSDIENSIKEDTKVDVYKRQQQVKGSSRWKATVEKHRY